MGKERLSFPENKKSEEVKALKRQHKGKKSDQLSKQEKDTIMDKMIEGWIEKNGS